MMNSTPVPTPSSLTRKPVVYMGMRTPWGKADHVKVHAEGFGEASTPGHGGFKLDAKRNKMVPEVFRKAGGWYEEDCEAGIVILFVGAYAGFDADRIESARKSVKTWYPDQYGAHFGVKVTAEESHVVREREAKAAAKGQLQSFAAWGDWAMNVPEGKVGVVAKVDGREGTGPDRYFLVPSEEYDARKIVFVVDPARHTEVTREDGRCPFVPRR